MRSVFSCEYKVKVLLQTAHVVSKHLYAEGDQISQTVRMDENR